MKIYRRYLAREMTASIILVLVAFLSLFSFFDMITEIKSVNTTTYQLHNAVAFILLRMPGRVYELMPVAVLIGTLYALSNLARHSEITVLRASGMSTQNLLSCLLLLALAFALCTFLVGEFVSPPCERAAQRMRLQEKGKAVGQDLRSGLWVKDEGSYINVQTVMPDASLKGIRIFDFDQEAKLRSVTEAEEGVYASSATWHLSQVTRRNIIGDDRAELVKKPDMEWRTALNPDILSVLMVSPDRMSLGHLASYTKHLSENKQKTQRYDIAMWKKVIYPLATLVMVTLALPFGYTHNRVSGVSLKIFSGVMIGVFFHMLNGLFSNLGAINSWSPFMSAIAPSALFMLAAAGMIWWVERR